MIRSRKLPALRPSGPGKAAEVLSAAGGAPTRGLCTSAGTATHPIREGAPHQKVKTRYQ